MIYTTLTLDRPQVSTLLSGQLLLDIETTGLSKQTDTIVCIGLLALKQHTLHYHAWFCESPLDEPLIIRTFFDFLEEGFKLYTFAGTHFDLAFIQEKAFHYHLDTGLFDRLPKIDIKRSPFYKNVFTSYRREQAETFLHFERSTTIKGRELVKIALLYFQTQETCYQTLLSNHQIDELLSLEAMLRFYSVLAVVQDTHSSIPYPISCETHFTLRLTPSTSWSYPFTLRLGYYELCYEPSTGLLTLSIAMQRKALKHFLPAKDYYIVQGELMHHSVAQFIPSALKTKATKQNAYIMQVHDCFPSPLPRVEWVDTDGIPCILAEEVNTYAPFYLKDLRKKITLG